MAREEDTRPQLYSLISGLSDGSGEKRKFSRKNIIDLLGLSHEGVNRCNPILVGRWGEEHR